MVALASDEWVPPAAVGPPRLAVLVHGVTGWHRTWWRVGPALADAGWRAVAVDLRGHGLSPRIAGTITVRDLADDLATFIDGLGSPVDAAIGHSLGAAVCAELAFQRPELVGRLVLEDPPAISRVGDLGWLKNIERELLAATADLEGEVERDLAANPGWRPEDVRQNVEGRRLADREGIVASFRRDVGTRVLDLVPLITVPALYLLADEARSVFPAVARRQLEATLPARSRVAVLDAGHTIHRDRFADYVGRVLAWLEDGSA